MALEDLTGLDKFISHLDPLNPDGPNDGKNIGPYHIRGIKNVTLNSFPNISGAITADQNELNQLVGKTLASDGDVIDNFSSNEVLLFQQETAPNGWVKETTHNDKALRVVNGTAGSGGAVAFSTVFGAQNTAGHTLTAAQTGLPNHRHLVTDVVGQYGPDENLQITWTSQHRDDNKTSSYESANASSAHNHDLDIRVEYVDIIMAKKAA